MKKDTVIILAENDDEHFSLIVKNLQRAGIWNEIIRFSNGQSVLDFLFGTSLGLKAEKNTEYILLMNNNISDIESMEVLKFIKADPAVKKIPVIIITEQDDPVKIEQYYSLGCSLCLIESDGEDGFGEMIQKCGLFFLFIEIPQIEQG